MVGNVVLVGNGPKGRAHVLGVDDVFDGKRDALQNPNGFTRHDPAFGILCFSQGAVSAERDEAIQLRLQSLRPRQYSVGDFERRNLLAPDASSQLGGREQARIIVHLQTTSKRPAGSPLIQPNTVTRDYHMNSRPQASIRITACRPLLLISRPL